MPSFQTRREICALLCIFIGLVSTTSHARIPDRDLEAMKILALGPKNNEVKQCLESSFNLLEGLLAAAQAPDSKVLELLTRGDMSANQRQLRELQATLWKEHHSPAKLANIEYGWCMKERGLPPMDLGEIGERCFNVAMVPAYTALSKTGLKLSETEALERITKTWSAQASGDWLRQVVSGIYAADTPERKQTVLRQIFMGCVATENANNSPTKDKK